LKGLIWRGGYSCGILQDGRFKAGNLTERHAKRNSGKVFTPELRGTDEDDVMIQRGFLPALAILELGA
jgi:hypothetical protein